MVDGAVAGASGSSRAPLLHRVGRGRRRVPCQQRARGVLAAVVIPPARPARAPQPTQKSKMTPRVGVALAAAWDSSLRGSRRPVVSFRSGRADPRRAGRTDGAPAAPSGSFDPVLGSVAGDALFLHPKGCVSQQRGRALLAPTPDRVQRGGGQLGVGQTDWAGCPRPPPDMSSGVRLVAGRRFWRPLPLCGEQFVARVV